MRFSLAIPCALLLIACRPEPSEPATPTPADPMVQPEVEPDPVLEVREVRLGAAELNVTVPVGAMLYYSFRSHGSVGLGASQAIADPAVVKYVRTDTAYVQSEAARAGKPGSDAATGTFVFEAVGAGVTTITVEELMRGEVQASATFTITVSGS